MSEQMASTKRFYIPHWALKSALQGFWSNDPSIHTDEFPNILSVEISTQGYVFVTAGTKETKETYHGLRLSE